MSFSLIEDTPPTTAVSDPVLFTTEWLPGAGPRSSTGAEILAEHRGMDGHGHEHVLIVTRELQVHGAFQIVSRTMSSCPSCGSTRSDMRKFGKDFASHFEMNAKNPKACTDDYHGRYRPGRKYEYLTAATISGG